MSSPIRESDGDLRVTWNELDRLTTPLTESPPLHRLLNNDYFPEVDVWSMDKRGKNNKKKKKKGKGKKKRAGKNLEMQS